MTPQTPPEAPEATPPEAPLPKATQTKRTFRMECAIAINVRAPAARIWALLTDAEDMPRWSSTVTRIRGPITQGTRLELAVPIAPKRVFKPRVTRLEQPRCMVWSDGAAPMFKGERTFTLTPRDDGSTDFEMVEVFRGLMLPMIKRALPDFGPAFEAYAADLKREAERGG